MVAEAVFTYDVVFFSFKVCELQICEVGAFFRGLITKAEFKNPSSTSTSHVATVMKWKTDGRAYVVIFYICL